eukprot:TRINITY_DN2571_c2_g1_i2.p1 TRINITY_DN2571_c2_g1~~TRINITY_DN2571_c2_g1_i2.p1  ORF type:complete len:438 (-),score=82.40 TRINITY_DN2571_c2_g1_i2:130-1443(-)
MFRKVPYLKFFGGELIIAACVSPLLLVHNVLIEVWGAPCLANMWGSLLVPPTLCVPMILAGVRLVQLVRLEQSKVETNMTVFKRQGSSLNELGKQVVFVERAKQRTYIPLYLFVFLLACVPALAVGVDQTARGVSFSETADGGRCKVGVLPLVNGIYGAFALIIVFFLWLELKNVQERYGVKRKLWQMIFYGLPLLIIWVIVRQFSNAVEGIYPIVTAFLIWEGHVVLVPVLLLHNNPHKVTGSVLHDTELSLTPPASTHGSQTSLPDEKEPLSVRLRGDPYFDHYFLKFLGREFSSENLLFWKAVELFRDSNGSLSDARIIIDCFIRNEAVLQVNLSAKSSKGILSNFLELQSHQLKQLAPLCCADTPALANLFQLAQSEVYNLLENDCMRRFVKSEFYTQYQADAKAGKGIRPASLKRGLTTFLQDQKSFVAAEP